MKIIISKPFAPLYKNNGIHNFILDTPRISGKSTELAQKVVELIKRYPNHDIICCRANANSLEESMLAEIECVLENLGYTKDIDFIEKKFPLRLEFRDGKGIIYFKGISGHDKSRVRSTKPKHKLSGIFMDECQQISSLENLKHALATFRRYLDMLIDYYVILAGNPHEERSHWWNLYCERYKNVESYCSIKSTYLDIKGLLNEETLKDIELEKEINPALYKFMYLGDLSDLMGGAYASFNREKHYITNEKAIEISHNSEIETILWGGDGAITHDATGIVPIAIMKDGRAFVLERFFYDPLDCGRVLAPSELAETINRYVEFMDKKYNIIRNGINSYFIIDCASEDLITQLRYTINDYHLVKAFTTKNIIRNNSSVNNCFARNMVYIINYGKGYFNWFTNKQRNLDYDPLISQLENVVWKGNKFDSSIPNDLTDALTYGLSVYYENPDNLYMPERNNFYE